MSAIQIHDKSFNPYITAAAIQSKVAAMATNINKDYQNKKPLIIAILNGSFMFAADLMKSLTMETAISFVKLASYEGTSSTGKIYTAIGLEENIKGRDIIVVEDIIDTGNTMHAFLPEIINQQPASLKLCTFLLKPDALQHDLKIDYCGFEIPDKFVVGYGMDYDGLGRNLKEIYQLEG